jgi:hypothetical protein
MNVSRDLFEDEFEEEGRRRGRVKKGKKEFVPLDEVGPNDIDPAVRDVFFTLADDEETDEDFDSDGGDMVMWLEVDDQLDFGFVEPSRTEAEVKRLAEEAAQEAWEQYLANRAKRGYPLMFVETYVDRPKLIVEKPVKDEQLSLPEFDDEDDLVASPTHLPIRRLEESRATYVTRGSFWDANLKVRDFRSPVSRSWKDTTRQPRQFVARVKRRRILEPRAQIS